MDEKLRSFHKSENKGKVQRYRRKINVGKWWSTEGALFLEWMKGETHSKTE